jgi:ubiquitin C-terminal hydrolase
MNSILQCLSNFHLLANFFVEKLYVDQINKNSETGGEIAIEFGEVVKALCSNQYKSISPVDFKRAIGKYKENFRGHDQQVFKL